jgi:hypothetical protein
VKRYAEDSLSPWEPLARDAEGIVTLATAEDAGRAALNPPTEAGLAVGDMLVVVPLECVSDVENHAAGLFVVTTDGVKAPPPHSIFPWLSFYGRFVGTMMCRETYDGYADGFVDPRRFLLVAIEAAREALRVAPDDDQLQTVVGLAIDWLRGDTCTKDTWVFMRPWRSGHNQTETWSVRGGLLGCLDAATKNLSREAYTQATCAAHAVLNESNDHGESWAPCIERWLPLPVVLLAKLGYPDAISFEPEPDAANASNTPVSTP